MHDKHRSYKECLQATKGCKNLLQGAFYFRLRPEIQRLNQSTSLLGIFFFSKAMKVHLHLKKNKQKNKPHGIPMRPCFDTYSKWRRCFKAILQP